MQLHQPQPVQTPTSSPTYDLTSAALQPARPIAVPPLTRSASAPAESPGRRMRRLRLAAGISVREMAQQLGVSRSTIQRYEANTTVPKTGVLTTIAKILGTTIEWLLAGEKKVRQYAVRFLKKINISCRKNSEPSLTGWNAPTSHQWMKLCSARHWDM